MMVMVPQEIRKQGSIDQNCFSVLEKAKATAKEAKAAHNYTDTAGFTLK